MRAPAWVLKGAAAALTLGAAWLGAGHVVANVYNSAAPLRPPVVGGESARSALAGGRLALSPSVQTGTTVTPVTSTYAS